MKKKKYKQYRPYHRKFFARSPCPVCGKMISNCGFAYTKHNDMHERQKNKNNPLK